MKTDFVAGRVSVVIPCRNEAKHIEKCVHAILASDWPDIEVFVVDGMSDDGTRELISRLSTAHPKVRLIDNVKQLTPYAFNQGVLNAQGEFVQIVGSRNILSPDYIRILVEFLRSHPNVGCVGGDYQHAFDQSSSRFIAWAMESKFGVGGSNYRTMAYDSEVDTVGVPMYRRAIFAEVGLFDEMLTRNQDDDYNFRVREAGYKIYYCHAAKTLYYVRASLLKAFWQYFQYGYFKVFVNQKHGTVTTLRQLVPWDPLESTCRHASLSIL